jgi:hypothetical protein
MTARLQAGSAYNRGIRRYLPQRPKLDLAKGNTSVHVRGCLRLAFAVPGPGRGRRRHVLHQLQHVVEAPHAVRVVGAEVAVVAEDRAAVGPEPGRPVAVERVVARLELAGGAVDAVAALGLVEGPHHVHVLIHRGGHRETVLVEEVLAVHQYEDRDVEGHADQLVLVGGDALDKGLGEVVPVEIRQRDVVVVGIVLARIDGVVDEESGPGLVEVIEVIGAELGTSAVTFCSSCSRGAISISTSMPVFAVNSSLESWLATMVGGVASEV